MSRPNNEKIRLTEQGNVTGEALAAYLRNELTPDEKQELEKLLQEDVFARDALEGLQKFNDQAAMSTSLSTLNKKVRERSGLKERKTLHIHWINYAYAAVILGTVLCIGFILVYFNGAKQQQLAMNNKSAPQEKTILEAEKPKAAGDKLASDSLNAALSGAATDRAPSDSINRSGSSVTFRLQAMDSVNKNNLVATSPPASAGVAGNMNATQSQNLSASSATRNSTLTADNEESKGYEKSAAGPEKPAGKGLSNSMNQPAAAARSERLDKSKSADKDTNLMADALKNFQVGQYLISGVEFDKVLQTEPDNAMALYFGAISDFSSGKTEKSEKSFDKLIKQGTKYLEGAKWYKANILLKRGERDAAKKIFQDLATANGNFKDKAKQRLTDMGF